ncbi:MAG TPA: glycosyltransferase family 4 protein [Burkholderiales bacterium]|nr:glycosyltransferase family 4 protein [Burkholderiales bacterium]
MSPLRVVHVVRRYGPVGGMERYVWETTRAMSKSGVAVSVLCEALHAPAPDGIEVVQLGEIAPRPRWLSLMRFSRRAGRWLRATQTPGRIVHSHERLGVHDVTTFHGPPFATIFERGWWRRASVRVAAQLWLERRELCAAQVRAVVPNSALIREQLARYYPRIGARMAAPIPPGVNPGPARGARAVPEDGGVIGFVGKEWKRKGLDIALAAAALLRRKRPGLKLLIVGPEAEEIGSLLSQADVPATCAGWADSAPYYPQMHVLLHPARAEPYGMVIAEAMAARVPVVVSDRCGIAPEVERVAAGTVLPLDARPQAWAAACDAALSRPEPPLAYTRSWSQVAQEYLALYGTLSR